MNKSYMKLLGRQHRTVLVFLLLVEAAFSMAPLTSTSRNAGSLERSCETGLTIGIIISMLIAVVMPMMLFSYIHRKSSVDLYFALPVSRRELLVTGVLFCWLAAFGCFAVSSVLVFAAGAGSLSALYLLSKLAWAAYSLLAVILCVTLVYTIANNIFDGFVLVCAYALLPVAILMAAVQFCNVMVAGNTFSFSYHLAGYLSPLFLCLQGILFGIRARNAVILFVFGLISCIGLRHEFIERKAERAQQISDGFFAYPFVIHLYALLALAYLVFAFYRETYTGMHVLFFLALFVVYMIATAVYRRSVRIRLKSILAFVLMLACCLGFTYVGWQTQGFGLAQHYSLTEGNELVYDYYNAVSKDDEIYYVSIRLAVPSKGSVKKTQAVQIMESLRQKCIADFYRPGEHDADGNLLIYNTSKKDAGTEAGDLIDDTVNSHNYYILSGTEALSADDVRVLQKAGASVIVTDIEGNEISTGTVFE